MKALSLFSGIGGIDLAGQWAGIQTIAFCEKDKYCQSVLNRHWPGVPIYEDIHRLTTESLFERGIDPTGIDLITGGFPCQPYSFAGVRLGEKDDRALWPEMRRVIRAIRPSWICAENVPGIISMALDDVLSDLESEGYETGTVILPACAVGAWHRRDRVFIIAHNALRGLRQERASARSGQPDPERASEAVANANGGRGRTLRPNKASQEGEQAASSTSPTATADSNRSGQQERLATSIPGNESLVAWDAGSDGSQWLSEPGVVRVVNGLSTKLDKALARNRLKALGNAVVPAQIYPILKAIVDYENEEGKE